uniref:ARAD1B22660p n=1 Tax=Blastobotrys adeninivorans TaxID=409370 RepID=A0A060T7T9_BLAAD
MDQGREPVETKAERDPGRPADPNAGDDTENASQDDCQTTSPDTQSTSVDSSQSENKGPTTPEKDTPSKSYAFITHSPETYPNSEPSVDNSQLVRRKRRRTTAFELSVLEQEFAQCSKPSKHHRADIAQRVGMSEKAVQIWFQNRRQSARKAALRANSEPGNDHTPTKAAKSATMPTVPQFRVPPPPQSSLSVRPQPSNTLPSAKPAKTTPHSHYPSLYRIPQTPTNNGGIVGAPVNRTPLSGSSSARSSDRSSLGAQPRPHRYLTPARTPVRLTMSDDGRAQLIESPRSPLAPISGSSLNSRNSGGTSTVRGMNTKAKLAAEALKTLNKGPKTPSKTKSMPQMMTPVSPATAEREKECITNLLSLRSGMWN